MNEIEKRKSNFTIVSNTFLRDERISFKAKGLFCYMYSMNDGWNFTYQSIAAQQKDGIDSIKSAMQELKNLGYVIYSKKSDGTGKYLLDDEPKVENPNVDFPKLGFSTRIKNNNSNKNNNNKGVSFSPKQILDFYKENISSLNSKIKEQNSFNQLVKNISEIEKIMTGLENYSKNLPSNKEFIVTLENFIKNKIYLDYQEAKKDSWTDGYDNSHLNWSE